MRTWNWNSTWTRQVHEKYGQVRVLRICQVDSIVRKKQKGSHWTLQVELTGETNNMSTEPLSCKAVTVTVTATKPARDTLPNRRLKERQLWDDNAKSYFKDCGGLLHRRNEGIRY